MGLLQGASKRRLAAQQLREGSGRETTHRGFGLAMPPLPPTPGGQCRSLLAGIRCPALHLCYLHMSAAPAAMQLPGNQHKQCRVSSVFPTSNLLHMNGLHLADQGLHRLAWSAELLVLPQSLQQ